MSRSFRCTGAAALAVSAVLAVAPGCASEPQPEGAAVAPPPMSPEQQESMEAYFESQAPGEHHRELEPLVGRFEAHVKHWMDPASPPAESTGVLENTWVLGGRFVLSEFRGEELGMPFEGIGLMGYDTVKQKHVGNWADSMGSFLWPTARGECSEGGDVITMTRVLDDPMTGALVKLRDVTTIVDDDHITYEIFATHPGTDEFRMLEAHYVRIPGGTP